jgi:uncharacterized protein (DUF927 family)
MRNSTGSEPKKLPPPEDAESRRKKYALEQEALNKWADQILDRLVTAIEAYRQHFEKLERLTDLEDEESDKISQQDINDPVIDINGGTRLSDEIAEAALRFGKPEQLLKTFLERRYRKRPRDGKTDVDPDVPGANVKRYGAFKVSDWGVFAKFGLQFMAARAYCWQRICKSRLDPIARSRDITVKKNWRACFHLTDETGRSVVEIPEEHLVSERAELAVKELARRGANIVASKQHREKLARFLRFKPIHRIIRVPQTGWFAAKPGRYVFIMPNETLTPAGGVGTSRSEYVLDGAAEADGYGFAVSGSTAEWVAQIAKPLAGNSNVGLAFGTFLAGPLLFLAHEPGGGFHSHGPSKIAKSLVGAFGQSIYGLPYTGAGGNREAFGISWDATAAGIEKHATRRSDVTMGLDEINVGDPKQIAQAIYKMTGGIERTVWNREGRGYRVLLFSTGEESVAEFLSSHGRKDKEGRHVRLTDIPAEVQQGSAFELIPADQISAAAARFYPLVSRLHGAVGRDWLQHLVNLGPAEIKKQLERHRGAWWANKKPAETRNANPHPQVISVLNRFALLAAALRMAIEAGLLPWSIEQADAAVINCMERWLSHRGDINVGGEMMRAVQRVRTTIAANLHNHFVHLGEDASGRLIPASGEDKRKLANPEEFDGFVKRDGRILVRPGAWRQLWAGCHAHAVVEHLRRNGWLIAGTDGEVPKVEAIIGAGAERARGRFYVLAPSFLDAPDSPPTQPQKAESEPSVTA